jgi:signal transduction histidine kinase
MHDFKVGREVPPETFFKDLNRQNSKLFWVVAIMAIVAWIPYAFLDHERYPSLSFIVYLRFGFTATGILAVLLRYSLLKGKEYVLVFAIFTYLQISTGIIAGATGLDLEYFGGAALVITLLTFWPFRRLHGFLLWLAAIVSLLVTAIVFTDRIDWPSKIYTVSNYFFFALAALFGILLLDIERKRSYFSRLALYQADRIKSEFLAIASHDLKNPLSVVKGYAEFIGECLHEKEIDRPMLLNRTKKIGRSVEKMTRLIQRFLKRSMAETGHIVLERAEVDVADLIEQVVENCRVLARKKKIEILWRHPGTQQAYIDPDLIEEVLENLLSNAIKFSTEGKEVEVKLGSINDVLKITVQDRGPGFSDEDKKQLFKTPQTLSAKPTSEESSSGLGLTIVAKFVQAHSGRIELDSELGRGSCFTVELPKRK